MKTKLLYLFALLSSYLIPASVQARISIPEYTYDWKLGVYHLVVYEGKIGILKTEYSQHYGVYLPSGGITVPVMLVPLIFLALIIFTALLVKIWKRLFRTKISIQQTQK